MFENISDKLENRKIEKKQKLREKNAQLRAEGKDPLKGWNVMVDTGAGGINSSGLSQNSSINPIDKSSKGETYFASEQKNVADRAAQRKGNKE
ncbi:hypothetical protein BAU15_01170 [Enterococcus sp. JM4C]|uniref:hypothetical protein n=1 Tax=Candidatus Enterococcus huntleyi TaxID=1857217 RepID=UPI00137A75DF|nr:hypothetical protein [Enterococcus sp. JM4C]KAF1299285.1 hypothetical protein BAU15_01170 [Enterococcus sp. JM4C]